MDLAGFEYFLLVVTVASFVLACVFVKTGNKEAASISAFLGALLMVTTLCAGILRWKGQRDADIRHDLTALGYSHFGDVKIRGLRKRTGTVEAAYANCLGEVTIYRTTNGGTIPIKFTESKLQPESWNCRQ